MSKIVVSGGNGYLFNHIKPLLHDELIYTSNIFLYQDFINVDMVIHFASPSDKEDFKNPYIHKTMIDGTINMVDLAKRNNAHFVFASTMGIYQLENDYCIFKYCMEKYIQKELSSYSILRIPRVYSSDREKGLIKQIKENTISKSDIDKKIKFILIRDFLTFFMYNYKNQGVFEIEEKYYQIESIKHIKEKICHII